MGDAKNGCFLMPLAKKGEILRIIASSDEGWDHVSVSLEHRIPTWNEMELVKKLFMGDVVAYQLHLPESQHINCHPNVLHIWRPWNKEIPLPPTEFV